MKHTLTPAAERDIRDILRQSLKRFGTRQLLAYQQIIQSGIEMVAEIPDRPGSLDRSDILPGLRLWHLELATGRRGALSLLSSRNVIGPTERCDHRPCAA